MRANRVAFCVGINETKGLSPLHGCRDDALQLKQRLDAQTGVTLYECHLVTDAPVAKLASPVTTDNLRAIVDTVFDPSRHVEVALFYFAGHGAVGGSAMHRHGFYLMTSDAERPEHGLPMSYVLEAANQCKYTQEKIIILDCCHSGSMGDIQLGGATSTCLEEGVSILAACRKEESAVESDTRGGLFTRIILGGLDGGAADPLGHVTLASIYSYVDLSLSLIQQRPIFKANISRLVTLSKSKPRMEEHDLKEGLKQFPKAYREFPLDHSYDEHILAAERECPYDPEHGRIFRIFQRMRAAGLLEPCEGEHLFWAAHGKKPCRLTPLGQLYWRVFKIQSL